ncbi:hypothetical protein OPKNFCMD_1325 [Methylobacterium crusticola]|uniref:Uncharacterized protein n=1 Tax=Methylobacterium crusticola TaxID=1697972 RepID=A0ABQ4QTV0_9HYPH|nr:hypothetical protein OPKNFCMD_1325 [Methylobacterium crusticola]
MGSRQVPGGSWVVQCRDSRGAAFALVASPAARAAPSGRLPALENAECPATLRPGRARCGLMRRAATRGGAQ